jgi:quinolinate synthase
VHERFSAEDIRRFKADHPGAVILAHPECPADVVAECDFAGSTSAMVDYVAKKHPARVVMLTECSMADNIAAEHRDVEFLRPCNLCPHMKRITLDKILRSLQTMQHEVKVDPAVAARAKAAVERMLAVGKPQPAVH